MLGYVIICGGGVGLYDCVGVLFLLYVYGVLGVLGFCLVCFGYFFVVVF